jgi:hypothetical protein
MAFARPPSVLRGTLCISLALAFVPVAALAAGGAKPPRAASSHAAPEVLTLDEAARFLRLKPQVVAELTRSAALPGRHVAGQWRFHRAALVDWLKGDRFASRVPAAAAPVVSREPPAVAASGVAEQSVAPAAPRTVAMGAPEQPQRAGATGSETVGEKPTAPTAEQTALRDQGVLLPAGRTTIEAGFSYGRAERQNFGLLRVQQDTVGASATVRHGLRDGLQISARLPAIYRKVATDVVPALGVSSSTRDTFAGDLSASLLGVVAREGVGRPNVVVSADAVLPTGPGDRGLGLGVVLSKSYDPVVLFGGANYMRGLQGGGADPRRVLGRHNLGFNFGYAYALNDSVALSGAFIASSKTDPPGQTPGALAPSRQAYQIQLGSTLQLGHGLFIEPAVAVGVGGSAPDVTISVSVPYTF